MKGDSPVDAKTKELWAYSTHVRILGHHTTQGVLQALVGLFRLPFGLWMVPQRQAGRSSQRQAEGLSHLRAELWTSVRHDVSWDPVEVGQELPGLCY